MRTESNLSASVREFAVGRRRRLVPSSPHQSQPTLPTCPLGERGPLSGWSHRHIGLLFVVTLYMVCSRARSVVTRTIESAGRLSSDVLGMHLVVSAGLSRSYLRLKSYPHMPDDQESLELASASRAFASARKRVS